MKKHLFYRLPNNESDVHFYKPKMIEKINLFFHQFLKKKLFLFYRIVSVMVKLTIFKLKVFFCSVECF
jgi:hypothetical protein